MSAPENFLSRWSRLKRENIEQKTSAEAPQPAEPTLQAPLPVAPVFDPASLPPIESIVADSDIRQFLQAGVPAELTRAALRTAWTADPDIRDFIGIADNQWDFNSEGAIPGFGALTAADYERPESAGPEMSTNAPEKAVEVTDELDVARAEEYSLLSRLLLRTPDAQLLSSLANLQGDSSPLGIAHSALAQAASRTDVARVSQEHFNLFVGLGRGELLPYASYYLTGFLHGRPLADIREMLNRLGIERTDGQTEPEDHAAILLEIMAGLTSGAIPSPPDTDREVFATHLEPWIGRFFSDLEQTRTADFYASVGAFGRVFMEIEAQGFLLPR